MPSCVASSFPGRRLHLVEAGANHDAHVVAPQAACAATAIHRRIAAAEHHDAPADPVDVPERHRRKPVDADVDVLRGLVAPRDVEVATGVLRYRRTPRRTPRPAALSCSRSRRRAGTRHHGRARSRPPRRSRRPADGTSGSASASSRPRWHRGRRRRSCSRAERGRARPYEARARANECDALAVALGHRSGRPVSRMSSLKSAAARSSRQIATGSGRVLRPPVLGRPFLDALAAARGLAGTIARPSRGMPGKTFDFQLTM